MLKKTCGFSISTANHMPGTCWVPLVQWVSGSPSSAYPGAASEANVCEAVASHPVLAIGVLVAELGAQCVLKQRPLPQSGFALHVSASAHLIVQLAPQSLV